MGAPLDNVGARRAAPYGGGGPNMTKRPSRRHLQLLVFSFEKVEQRGLGRSVAHLLQRRSCSQRDLHVRTFRQTADLPQGWTVAEISQSGNGFDPYRWSQCVQKPD